MITNHPHNRFAVYLIPPYEIARTVAEIHRMLRKQFGLIAASRFPVHATLKGFFKATADPMNPLVERLDAIFAAQHPFPVHFCGIRRDPAGISLDISCLGEGPNPALLTLREQIVGAARPFVAPDCDFSGQEQEHPFGGHITLAFRVNPPALLDQILDYMQDARLPSEPFIVDTFYFLEFSSQDWAGDWAPTLTWRLLKSWRLGETKL